MLTSDLNWNDCRTILSLTSISVLSIVDGSWKPPCWLAFNAVLEGTLDMFCFSFPFESEDRSAAAATANAFRQEGRRHRPDPCFSLDLINSS